MSRISTGFLLTPPSKTKKGRVQQKQDAQQMDFNTDALFENLMSCPIKKQLVFKLLESERENIEEYKRKEATSKLKQKNKCESPSALLRRRALEQLHKGGPSPAEETSTSRSTSSASNASYKSSPTPSPVPYNEIMKGVITYVEIQKEGHDKSAGAKLVLSGMGAIIQDNFTNDVTHVVFKDGSFTTYQKAKLKNVPLVSLLWVEMSRRNGQKQSEKLYPATGSYDKNVSTVCSQMYKEYEDIIKEEYHRSIVKGLPLPTTQSLIERRRTLTTSSVSSFHSARFSPEFRSSQDREVESIMRRKTMNILEERPEVTDDDSDIEPIINGTFLEKSAEKTPLKSLENITELSMSLTGMQQSQSVIPSEMTRRKSCFMDLTDVVGNRTKKKVKALKNTSKKTVDGNLSDRSTNISNDSDRTKSIMSTLQVDSDKTKSTLSELKSNSKSTIASDKTRSSMSSLRLTDKTKSTVESDKNKSAMSSLRISSNFEIISQNVCEYVDKPAEKSTVSTNMSSLSVSDKTDSKKSSESFASAEDNFIDETSINRIIDCIKTPINAENVTLRKKVVKEPVDLDDSEIIISPKKKTVKRKSNINKKAKVAGSPPKKQKIGSSEASEKKKAEDNKKNCATPRKSIRVRRSTTHFTPSASIKARAKKTDSVTIRKARKSLSKAMEEASESDAKKSQKTPTRPVISNSSDDNAKKTKKVRKLYNPDDSVAEKVNDEKEREQKRKKAEQEKNNKGVFVNPAAINVNLLLSARKKQIDSNDSQSDLEISITPPKKPVRKKDKPKKASLNSSADRQEELLKEVINEKKSSEKKPKKQLRRDSIPISPIKRRSTLDFQKATPRTPMKKLKMEKPKQPTIVCTKLHKDDVLTFCQIVKKLGRFTIEDEVSSQTTHLVAGEPKRTINMLRAVARGCWVLRHEWLLKSLEEGRWLPEEDFEITDFAPIVQQSRRQRDAFGPKYTLDVFEDCPAIYVARGTNPRCSDLRELVVLCKGRIVLDPAAAKIVVGDYFQDATCVKETWVLDCITVNKVKPFKKYLLKPPDKKRSLVV